MHAPAQVEQIIADANRRGRKVRVVGNALSPNGIGLSTEAMMTLALCDKVLAIDPEKRTVRVQAGARVQQVVDALRPHK
jgi:L-galactono-1,4-lactone dehydrogenase